MSVETQVKEIVAKQLRKDLAQVVDSARFVEDLGADSLGTMELLMEIEDKLGVKIPEDQTEKFKTVGDLVSYINANQA